MFYGSDIHQKFIEMVKEMAGIVSEINMSGSMKMKVYKDTFLIVEQQSVFISSLEQSGIAVETIQEGTYTYTYNEVEQVEIPEEVIQEANS